MRRVYNIYCDESGHLENDGLKFMMLGALWGPADKAREIAVRLREIKVRHGLAPSFEIKWTKVGPAKKRFYLDLLDYFFDDDDLHFRGVLVDKNQLDHDGHGSDHDTWYYKMYFRLITAVIEPGNQYRVYLDIKDTRSQGKVEKLHEVLCNSEYDFRQEIVERVQHVRSHEVEQVQLADLIMGAIAFANRGNGTNAGKWALVERMKQRSGLRLDRTTLLRESKLNLLAWVSRKGRP